MSDYVLEEHAIDAMCIWEEVIEQCNRGNKDLYEWLCDGEGAFMARENALHLVVYMNAAWDFSEETRNITYDWEFIPLALPIFSELPFKTMLEFADVTIKEVAVRVVEAYRQEVESNPQMALDL